MEYETNNGYYPFFGLKLTLVDENGTWIDFWLYGTSVTGRVRIDSSRLRGQKRKQV